MSQTTNGRKALKLAVLVLIFGGGIFWMPVSANTCYGTWYDYFDGPSHNEIVGSKVVCPGIPDQIDYDVNGNYTETPWFTTGQAICPCGGSGGGGSGGSGEDEDSEG